MNAFIDSQLDLVANERKLEVEETTRLLSACSPAQLQKRGVALVGLRIASMRTGLGGKSLLDLELAQHLTDSPRLPSHKIRTGDIVGLQEYKKDKPTSQTQLSGVVSRVTDTTVTVALQGREDDELPQALQDRCQIVKLANNITYERMTHALNDLKRDSSNTPLQRVLFGLQAPDVEEMKEVKFFDDTLNDSQREAVRFALASKEIALVHGPPGKTYTLIEIIRQLAVVQEKRVLVCGPSNISVDNLVERLSKHRVKIVRLGHPARILPNVMEHSLDIITRTCDSGQIVADIRKEMDETLSAISKSKNWSERRGLYGNLKDLRKDFRVRERKVVGDIIHGSEVVLSTLNGCGARNMMNQEFDVVIIDEATQALEAECWIALRKGKKAILAGDHLQLPPTVKSKSSSSPVPIIPKTLEKATSLSVTLFDRLLAMYGNKVKRMLKVQYRMHHQIMEFPSRELYDKELTADPSVSERLLMDLEPVEETDDTSSPVVFIDTAGAGLMEAQLEDEEDSKLNEGEVEKVIEHVENLLQANVSEADIGVITPYSAQVSKLNQEMKDRWPDIEIGTVDGFQGREKEAIIVSLVRSNDNRQVGFLGEKRRLNVAMTRAKRHLCIIGDSDTLSSSDAVNGAKKGKKDKSAISDGGFLKRWMAWLSEEADVRYCEYA
ncbi:hypothetical protein INT44_008735 [Umbelopsis vinacea]|uniref:DNA helicase n=1 Tax=Umbelopsis vinacea TaxID=44442 RepID=A0A8H7PGD8_9FUNG|nr:hypothetical protein INT44_008735 [Umbelopsis vinacea]